MIFCAFINFEVNQSKKINYIPKIRVVILFSLLSLLYKEKFLLSSCMCVCLRTDKLMNLFMDLHENWYEHLTIRN
jgi:hypothetical protein